jgi:hypothetical protein
MIARVDVLDVAGQGRGCVAGEKGRDIADILDADELQLSLRGAAKQSSERYTKRRMRRDMAESGFGVNMSI